MKRNVVTLGQLISISCLLIICSVISWPAKATVPYLNWDYPERTTVATYMNETVYYVDIKLDDLGNPHIIFLKDFEDRYAFYISHFESGSFTEPVRVYVTPTIAEWVGTDYEFIVTVLDHSTDWHILYKYDDSNTGNTRLIYLLIADGVVQHDEIILERWNIVGISDLEIDSQNNPHVALTAGLPEDGNDYHFYYFKKENGQFREVIREKFGSYVGPDTIIYLENEHIRYAMIDIDSEYHLVEICNEEVIYISDPLENISSRGNFRNCRIIIDFEGNLNIFLWKTGYTWDPGRMLHFVPEDCGRTWSEPKNICEVSFEFPVISDPVFLPDGGIVLAHTRYIHSYPNSFWDGFVQIDRGYGFGNSDNIQLWGVQHIAHKSLTVPAFKINNEYHLYSAVINAVPDNGLKVTVEVHEYVPVEYETPHIKISTPYTWGDDMLWGDDLLRICLDLYNPTNESVELEMAMGCELSCLPGYFFFISDQEGFPTFDLDYALFRLTLPPGSFYQSVPIISFPLIDLVPLSDHFTWRWYAVLLDPLTSELISYSQDQCGYSHYDNIPD